MRATRHKSRATSALLAMLLVVAVATPGCGLTRPGDPYGTFAVTGRFFEHIITWEDPSLAFWLLVFSPILFPAFLAVDALLLPVMIPYDIYLAASGQTGSAGGARP